MFDYAKFATLEGKLGRLKKIPAFMSALKSPTFFTDGTREQLAERQAACRNELTRLGRNGGLDDGDRQVLTECLTGPCDIGPSGIGLLDALLAAAGQKPFASLAVFDYGKFAQSRAAMTSLRYMPALDAALMQPSFFIAANDKGLGERRHACRAELKRHADTRGGFTDAEVEILRSCMLVPCDIQRDGSAFIEALIACGP